MSNDTRMRYNYAKTGTPSPAPSSGTATRSRFAHGGQVSGVKHGSRPAGFRPMSKGGRTSY